MLVTVNGNPVDYTLESESVLGQVVAGIEKALNDERMVVTSLRLGDRELAAEPEAAWAQTRLDSVSRLDITACPLADLEREQVALLGQYLKQLASAVGDPASPPVGALEGFADAATAARLRLDVSAGSPAARGLGVLEQLLGPGARETPATWPEGIRDRALRAIADLSELAQARLTEIDSPGEALRTAATAMEGCSRDLADVSLLLQTGQQEKAMGQVTRFAALMQSTMRSLARLHDSGSTSPAFELEGRPLPEFIESMNAVMRQAVEALEARDTVLLGDLLEYEIAPRLKSLSTFLGSASAGRQEIP